MRCLRSTRRQFDRSGGGIKRLRKREHFLSCSIVIADNEMRFNPYLHHVFGGDTPVLKIRKVDGGLWDQMAAEFEKFWSYNDEQLGSAALGAVAD